MSYLPVYLLDDVVLLKIIFFRSFLYYIILSLSGVFLFFFLFCILCCCSSLGDVFLVCLFLVLTSVDFLSESLLIFWIVGSHSGFCSASALYALAHFGSTFSLCNPFFLHE